MDKSKQINNEISIKYSELIILTWFSAVQLIPENVDLQLLLDSEDVHLGGMDGVEDEGEDQRQEEGRPASQQKVEDGNILSPDGHISAIRISHSQDSQAGENI